MKKVILSSVLVLLSCSAVADYRYEVEGSYFDFNDEDRFYDDSYNTKKISIDIAFNPISLGSGPWDEAKFLSKESSVNLSVEKDSYSDGDSKTYSASTEVVASERFIFQGEVSMERYSDPDSSYDYMINTITAGLGMYLNDTNSLSFSSLRRNAESRSNSRRSLNYHGVYASMFAVDAGIYYERDSGAFYRGPRSLHGFSADFTYYPLPQLGLTLGLDRNSSDDEDTLSPGFKVKYYIVESVALSTSYEHSKYSYDDGFDDDSYSTHSFTFAVTGRF